MSVDQILEEVKKHPARHCVLTGGEPMIARGIHELASALRLAGYHITIETAGTIAPSGIACDLASISPKLAHSTPTGGSLEKAWIERHERTRLQPDILRDWLKHYPFQLKFVYSQASDLKEVESLIESLAIPVPASKVMLMPEATSESAMAARQSELIAICLKRGFRYCDRLHIRLFGNKRGT
jgi:7-carboxy-7-deazaguanine synthase